MAAGRRGVEKKTLEISSKHSRRDLRKPRKRKATMGIFWGEKVERSCAKPRRDLHDCIYQSDCVRKDGLSPRHCLRDNKDFPEECQKYSILLFECKHSLMDMRQRFRGRKGEKEEE